MADFIVECFDRAMLSWLIIVIGENEIQDLIPPGDVPTPDQISQHCMETFRLRAGGLDESYRVEPGGSGL